MRATFRLVVLAAAILAILALSAQARPRTRREFLTHYPKATGTRLDACTVCHAAALPALNSYGEALKKAKFKFAEIEKLDSDGDRFLNRAEIDSLRFPGDATDHPAGKRASGKRDSAAADSVRKPRPGG
jgi:hypothetical protein